VKIDWAIWALPGGTAFCCAFFGCYGFAYDFSSKARDRLTEALLYA
jgi:hypothetical protein